MTHFGYSHATGTEGYTPCPISGHEAHLISPLVTQNLSTEELH